MSSFSGSRSGEEIGMFILYGPQEQYHLSHGLNDVRADYFGLEAQLGFHVLIVETYSHSYIGAVDP